MGEFIAGVKAFVQLMQIAQSLVGYLKKQFGDNWEKYLGDLHTALVVKLPEANTPEKKQDVAKDLSNLIRRL